MGSRDCKSNGGFARLLAASLLMGVSFTANARPLPDSVRDAFPLTRVGQGVMTWFGISIYEASLWTQSGSYKNFDSDLPLVLHITYKQSIQRQELVDATVEQWERLGYFDRDSRRVWKQRLENVWPDVKPGDSITTVVLSDRSTQFFANEKLIAEIKESVFGRALISIWLHPDTDEPELRKKLIRG